MGIFRKMVDLRHHEIEHTNGFVKGCRPLRGLDPCAISILGLTPQALCRRPLRSLSEKVLRGSLCKLRASVVNVFPGNFATETQSITEFAQRNSFF